ncbi:TetR/AcrR family transcriptional regulator [Dietzia timorensis]|uniref:Putative HTH-type transcriptional regulator n=1 Tax=Dietzia timorensis TaxID=499555 RepID=A0A173LQ35_9ACTN|nr:TetR/AcrR family transcriptional regulator [Dietzia timorensis]ANI93788.1 putative HTH-type transcriptional regulator [Dietzia timorensis]
MSSQGAVKASPRERLLSTATELFTTQGIRAVGIDRILKDSRVAKASLYNSYGSKDALVVAYLEHMHTADEEAWSKRTAPMDRPRDRILAFFDLVLASGSIPMGSPFIAAALEFPEPTTAGERAIRAAVDTHRQWVLDTITEQLRLMGLQDPDNIEEMALRLVVLLDGAVTAARMLDRVSSTMTARAMAEMTLRLVD